MVISSQMPFKVKSENVRREKSILHVNQQLRPWLMLRTTLFSHKRPRIK